MKGCRSLTDEEIEKVKAVFDGSFELRDRAIFILGIRTGLRISEILSVKISQIFQDGKLTHHLYVPRRNMKGKVEGRRIPLHEEARQAIGLWLIELNKRQAITLEAPLFIGRKGQEKAISRVQAWRILENAFAKAGLVGALATHTLRKTYARRIHKKLNFNLVDTQIAMNHRSLTSTVRYLSGDNEKVDAAILAD